MANINSKYRVSNGKDYGNIYHFETNSRQVLMSDGRKLSEVLEGKSVNNQNLTSLKSDGKYMVTNSVGLPTGLNASLTYLLKVETVDSNVWQTLYDHIGNNVYTRCMTQLGFSAWSNGGKDIQEKVSGLTDKYNNLEFDVKQNTKDITDHKTKIANILSEMGQEVTAHNHDERYVKKDGGIYTGHFGMNNNISLIGNTTSGSSKNIARVNSNNIIEIGDSGVGLNIYGNEVRVNGQPVIHAGNVSQYASAVGGGGGDVYKSGNNTFTGSNNFKSELGISSSISFKKSDGTEIAKMYQDSSDVVMKLRSSEVFRVRSSDNALIANQKLILRGDSEVWLRMGLRNDADQGFGFRGSSTNLEMHDWGNSKIVYSVNRSDNCVEFTNSIRIHGQKISVGTWYPSNPKKGDIWIG